MLRWKQCANKAENTCSKAGRDAIHEQSCECSERLGCIFECEKEKTKRHNLAIHKCIYAFPCANVTHARARTHANRETHPPSHPSPTPTDGASAPGVVDGAPACGVGRCVGKCVEARVRECMSTDRDAPTLKDTHRWTNTCASSEIHPNNLPSIHTHTCPAMHTQPCNGACHAPCAR